MYKYIIGFAIVFSGCSQFAVNGMMCDQIRQDPFSTIPSECRVYSEEAASKASRTSSELLKQDDFLIFEKEK